MRDYRVIDIWRAVKLSLKNLLYGFGALFVTISFLSTDDLQASPALSIVFVVLLAFIPVSTILIFLANRSFHVDNKKEVFVFPASDVENSILAILVLLPYWNLMRRRKIQLSQIENVYLNTERGNKKENGRYNLNIAGAFGSAKLVFGNRQKRDELRNALQVSVKQSSGKNIDRKLAEFA